MRYYIDTNIIIYMLRPSVTAFRSSAQTGSLRNMRDMASTLYSTKDRYGNSSFSSYDSRAMHSSSPLVEDSKG